MSRWKTIQTNETQSGFVAMERADRFRLEALTEILLRVGGIAMILAAILWWILLPAEQMANFDIRAQLTMALSIATGLGLFAYGSRGFRRQLRLDSDAKTLSMTKVNVYNQTRVENSVAFSQVESVYIKRPETPGGTAALFLRVTGSIIPLCALSGSLEDVTELHVTLCSHVRSQAPVTPRRVLPRRVRPALS